MMSGFRRSHSKVWWANYFHDRGNAADDEASSSSLSSPFPQFNRRRRRSTDDSNSDRNSSSSPSNGSQKSQDSGFSDSESSTPSNGSAKGESTSADGRSASSPAEAASTFGESSSRLLGTPVNRIPRLVVITPKPNESTSSEELRKLEQEQTNKLVSTYLAECYFPITTLIEGRRSSHASQLPSVHSCPSSSDSDEESSVSLQSPRENKRTCFIVGETPKKQLPAPVANESPSPSHDGTAESTMEGSYSLSYDDTIKENQEYHTCENECHPSQVESVPAVVQPPSIRADATYKISGSSDSVVSRADSNYLPEPTFTSTPKKDLQISRRPNVKLRDSIVPEVPEMKPEPVEEREAPKLVDPPVVRWLFELQYHYEVECMTTLQAKRIPQYYKKKTSDILMVSESTSSAQTFQHRTKLITDEFLKLYESVNLRMYEYVNSQLSKLISDLKEFIINYSQLLPRMESVEKENVLRIMDMCDHFQKLFIPFDQKTLLNELNMLEKFFSQFVDSILVQQMMLLISELDHPNSENSLLTALNSIVTLNLSTPRTLDLVTHLDGIQKLLTISLKSSSSAVRKTALRSLTTVCQNASSIRQLERARGVEMLSEMLCDEERDEVELSEVISVLVQITAPWIEDDHIIKGLIYHLYPIINALTRLITATSSSETLLLCAAALANISFIEPQAVFIVAKLGTLSCLLTAVRKLGVRASIFLQEQVATLIANMAADSKIRPHLAQHRAIGALLCFLQVKHFPLQTEAEIAAAERLQHKSAVALSRLCSNPEIAKQVVELQGVSRLVRLCREERERNYSDGVLVACLTSLRKITANCGSESIVDLNAKELVEPRLVDSFLMYSSKQESYV